MRSVLRSPAAIIAGGVLGGVVFGVVDRIVATGPAWATELSNVAAFWLAAAFIAGRLTKSYLLGAITGLLCLIAALIGYYGYMHIIEHAPRRYLEWRASPWVSASMIVGPVFGALGADWARRRSRLSAGILAASFVLDAVAYFAIGQDRISEGVAVHVGVLAAGLLLGLALLFGAAGATRHQSA